MAVPWINFLAPSMGGIGPIELADLPKLNELTEKNGIPFYAGRFYPKDSQAIIDGTLQLGLISQTPPWLTWEEIESTQIWMVPVFEDERVVSTVTTIERIDLWPRDPEEGLPEWEQTYYDDQIQSEAWGWGGGLVGVNIDPGIEVTQNVVPPALFLGYVGISAISGRITEYAFYDQEMTYIKAPQYNMPGLGGGDYEYTEITRVRGDGIWTQSPAELPEAGTPFEIEENGGYPGNLTHLTPSSAYQQWAMSSDITEARLWGNETWNELTKFNDQGEPQIGTFQEFKTSELDTVVFTIKVSAVTVVVPDEPFPDDVATGLADYTQIALETLGSNLSNNIWYFYLPVRYNGEIPGERIQYLLNRAAINQPDA